MKTKQESIFSSKALTYFIQLTETMNYTQAAQILGITQPALTQQIKKLEKTVGAPLFYSVGKKLHVSDAGKTMLKTTHEIFDLLNKTTDEIQQSTSATKGKIIMGCLSSIEDVVFEQFIIEYFKQNSEIEISLFMLSRKEIWERLENNTIDIAIMYLPDDSIKNWKPYESKRIVQDDLLFLTRDTKFANMKKVKFKNTLDKRWSTYPEKFYLSQTISEAYKNHLVDAPVSAVQLTTPFQINRFMEDTDTYAALPATFVDAHRENDEIIALPFDPPIQFDMAFVYRKEKSEIPRISHFYQSFDQFLDEEGYVERLKNLKK